MAKKSGGGLDPGADATIVAAAYRAGMGHVPGDYSKTFQGIATGYSKAMEKMGAGLAKAAEVGAGIAAPLIEQNIQNYKTYNSRAEGVHEDYGDALVESIYGDGGALELLKEERKAFAKMPWGPERKKLRLDYNKKRDKLFGHIRQLQKGEFINTANIAEGDWNPEASGNENSLLHLAIGMKGKPIEDGEYAGVYVKSVIDEDGSVSLQLMKDGKGVSGLNDDGTLEYHSEEGVVTTSYEFTGEGAEYRALGGKLSVSDANPISALNFYSNSKNTRKKSDYKKIQESLNKIGITDSDGNVLDVDGEWGPKSRSAYDKYLAQKDDLETAWLDENLSEEDKSKYQTTTTTPSTTEPLTVTPENIEKLIVPKDYKMRENLTAIDLNELKNGTNGFDFRENDIRRQIGEQIKTSAQLKDAMHAPLANMDGTYADYLGQPNEWTQEMYSVLENMSGIQDIGEPGIDADDFAGEQGAANMSVLRKEMLNANNPASKKMFVDWYTEGIRKTHAVEKAKYDKKLRNKTEVNNKRKVKNVFNNEMYYKDIDGNTMQGGPLNKIITAIGSETGIDGWIRQEDGSFKKGNQTISGQQLLETIGDQVGMSLVTMGDYFDEFNTTVGASDIDVGTTDKTTDKTTNLDYIVDNIWEPDNVAGYGADRNANALVDYLAENFEYDGEYSWSSGKYKGEIARIKIGDYWVGATSDDTEYIRVWSGDTDPTKLTNSNAIKRWGGDSTGGKGYDKDDIMELFALLGIENHLTQNR